MLGEMFEARARGQTRFVNTVCSVLTVLTVPFGVGVVIVAVMLPMITLLQRLSG
jgi:hypothetical protein